MQQLFQSGLTALQAQRWSEAERAFSQILIRDPAHIAALCLRADALAGQGHLPQALDALNKAATLAPNNPDIVNNLGVMFERAGDRARAEACYRKAIALRPDFVPALTNLGIFLRDAGRLTESLALFDKVLKFARSDPGSHLNRASVLRRLGQNQQALKSFEAALALAPRQPVILINRALLLKEMGRKAEALADLDAALLQRPSFPEALVNKGVLLLALGRGEEALAAYDKALALRPNFHEALCNRGNALNQLGRPLQALTCFDEALKHRPNASDARNGRAAALIRLHRPTEALTILDGLLASNPAFLEAQANLAEALLQLNRPREALSAAMRCVDETRPDPAALVLRAECHAMLDHGPDYLADMQRALSLVPDNPLYRAKLGDALLNAGRPQEALDAYRAAQALAPNQPGLAAALLRTRVMLCDWSNDDLSPAQIHETLASDPLGFPAFSVLALSQSEPLNAEVIGQIARKNHAPQTAFAPTFARKKRDKIRIGYFSGDFRSHATAYLMAELFELHDRRDFEWVGVTFGPDDGSALRNRLKGSFDHWLDVDALPDRDAAAAARRLELDIAIDLKGYTQFQRFGIFAHRAAPIQVNYLGYPGSLYSPQIDYCIADRWTIPPENESCFSEKIVRLPYSYLMNDRKRDVSTRRFTRAELGLPDHSMVYCSFNANHKILPQTFDLWMQILAGVEGSVLWLLQGSERVVGNLRNEAYRRGINPARLVFAPKAPVDEHLARHACADLFLDTLPYNAHTTAIDALWMGLPLLTLIGHTFPGRVGASLLNSLGMPELIATTAQDYVRTAIALGQDPQRLTTLKAKLASQRDTAPLFDTPATARALEAAYRRMIDLYDRGAPPQSFSL